MCYVRSSLSGNKIYTKFVYLKRDIRFDELSSIDKWVYFPRIYCVKKLFNLQDYNLRLPVLIPTSQANIFNYFRFFFITYVQKFVRGTSI